MERRNGHGLCRHGGLADESEGIGPPHFAVEFRISVFVGTGARHVERALGSEFRRSTGGALVGKQVVVFPDWWFCGSTLHLLQVRQIHKGAVADAVQGRGQRHLLQRRTAHEGKVANPSDSLADGHLRQLVAQAEGQLVHRYFVFSSADSHLAGNGDGTFGVL